MNQLSSQHMERDQNPAEMAQFPKIDIISRRSTLLIAIAIAVILRVGSAIYQGNEVETLPGVFDQVSYDALARRVVAGHGFSFAEVHWPITRAGEPTAHWSYLYTLYLSAIYGSVGAYPLVARLLQAVIAGALHCWLAWRIGRRIGCPTVGLGAAILSAVYIYFFYYAGALMTETFYIVGILWTLDCAMRLAESLRKSQLAPLSGWARWRLWLELGLAVGITLLLRQVFLLFVPFLFLWLWWDHLRGVRAYAADSGDSNVGGPVMAGWGPRIRPLFLGSLLAGLVVGCLIVPWTIRNYRVFHTFVLLNTNSGYAFFWGNHPIYGTHFVGILPAGGPSYQDLIPDELRHLNEAELDRALFQEGVAFIASDPVRYLLLSVSRTREYFKFWPSPDSGLVSNVARVGSFGIFLPFILYGLVFNMILAWRKRDTGQGAAIFLLLLFCVVYTGIHLLTWAMIRYRLPVDAILLIFAAGGIVDLARRMRSYLSANNALAWR
jgi:hypothetical protein